MCDLCIVNNSWLPLVNNLGYCDIENLTIIFYNLGLIQAERRRPPKVCSKCSLINILINSVVADDVKLFFWLDSLLNLEEFETFQRQLIRDVLDKQHFGRVLILLTCFTRAARLWSLKNLEFEKIEKQIKNTGEKLKGVLPNFVMADFMNKIGIPKEETFWQKLWNSLGELTLH